MDDLPAQKFVKLGVALTIHGRDDVREMSVRGEVKEGSSIPWVKVSL
jgi:hypothetical protein